MSEVRFARQKRILTLSGAVALRRIARHRAADGAAVTSELQQPTAKRDCCRFIREFELR